MTTTNHTDIAIGAAGDSAIVNAPLGQLDAAIGNRTSLTTTDKTTLVAAVNEVDAHADAVQTQVNVSLAPSGTIKTGAINVNSMVAPGTLNGDRLVAGTVTNTQLAPNTVLGSNIAPGQITGDKIAPDAFAAPNLIWDDHHLYVRPVIAEEWGGVPRWHPRTQTALDAVVRVDLADPDNPYGAPTLVMINGGGGLLGKYISHAECSIKAGDKMNFSVLVKPSIAAGTFQLRAAGYDAANVQIPGSITFGVGFDFSTNGAMRALTTVPAGGGSYVVPVGAVRTLVWIQQNVTGSDLKWFSEWGNKGLFISQYNSPTTAPTNFYQEIIDGRGTYDTLADRLDNFSTGEDRLGRQFLRDWQGAIGNVQAAVAGTQAVIAVVGDSWVVRDDIRNPLRTMLKTLYGDAGVGWVGFAQCEVNSAAYQHGFTYTKGGTWGSISDRLATSLGVDISHMISSGTGGTITIAVTDNCTDLKVQYYQQTGGGSFTWAVDGGGATTVNTAGTAGVQVVTITGLTDGPHTLVLTVTAAGSANVILLGVDVQRAGNGVRVHRCGCSGSTSLDFVDVAAAQWEASLAALAPNLVIILLGTNDATQPPTVAPGAYGANLQTLTDRVHAVLPRCDVLLMPSADNGSTSIGPWDDAARDAALTKLCGYLSSYANMGPYADANARGLMANTTHPNAAGGRVIANLAASMLTVV